MDDDLFRRGAPVSQVHTRDNLFTWTILILLLIGFAFACWIGSFYLFGHPENPRSYAILKKLNKIEPPKRFELTAAPVGEFLSAQKIFERYGVMSRLELQRENAQLLRDYISNYQNTKKLVPYVIGRYSILDSYELKQDDLFASGVVALAQSSDLPQVLIEHVYTSPQANIGSLKRMLLKGLELKLERTLDLSAVIHVERRDDGRIQLTVVPLLYGNYAVRQGTGFFSLEPPEGLNLVAGVPILKSDRTEAALKNAPEPENAPQVATKKEEGATIVRVEPVATPIPLNQPAPTPIPVRKPTAVATPVTATTPPVTTQTAVPAATPLTESSLPIRVAVASTPAPPVAKPVAPAIPVAQPVSTPAAAVAPAMAAPVAVAAARPSQPVATPGPVVQPEPAAAPPLQPFLAAAPTPNVVTTSQGAWRTFSPGQMPRGRLIAPDELGDYADRSLSGERVYLRGNFSVTASGDSRAVLRPQGNLSNIVRGTPGNTRVIVEYPAGSVPPGEGSTLSRDEMRPFQIIDVRKGADGQTNVYVREITTP